MASWVEDTKHKHALRAATPNSGFSVRKAEETIKNLEKENFNLKLKIFLLESKKGVASNPPELNEATSKEYFELFVENEEMKNELEEKLNLLKSALDVIQILEDEKLNYEKKLQEMMVKQQIETLQVLKVNTQTMPQEKPKKARRKKSQVKFLPLPSGDCEEDSQKQLLMLTLRADNDELTARVKDLEKEVEGNVRANNELSAAKLKLEEKLSETEVIYVFESFESSLKLRIKSFLKS